MKLLSTALVLLVALVGCREVITEPAPNPTAPGPRTGDPSVPSESAPRMYLKGPKSMVERDEHNFRGEPLENVTYAWHWSSPDGGAIESDDPRTERVFDARAVRRGTVTVTMTARDFETGQLIGVGRRTIKIYPFGTPPSYPGDDNPR